MFLRFHITSHRLMWMATKTPDNEMRVECGSFDRGWQRPDDDVKGKAVMLLHD